MKRTFSAFGIVALGITLAIPLLAQGTPPSQRPRYGPNDRPVPLPVPQDVVEGEAYFLERIAIPADSKLFVTLVGRVAGAEYLPLASTIVPAHSGTTPFRLLVPQGMAPEGPYRLQAWIVANNRLLMNGVNPQTMLQSLGDKARIRLKMVPAPQNIDGIGDGKPMMEQNQPGAPATTTNFEVKGTIEKRDRRGIAPDTQIEVKLSDVSQMDAPAKVVGSQTFSADGKQMPLSFAVPVNLADIKEKRRYSLMVRVTEGGRLMYITDTHIPVTPDNIRMPFALVVRPVGG